MTHSNRVSIQANQRVTLAVTAFMLVVSFSGCAILRRGSYGCGSGMGCGETCEVGCAMEPSCGVNGCGDTCSNSCGIGASYAGQKWIGSGNCEGPKFNICSDCSCSSGSDCGCEPACGCAEPACGCGGDVGCDDGCCNTVGCCDSCGPSCGGRCQVGSNVRYGIRCIAGEVRQIFTPFCGLLGGCVSCGGCDGELYWNEWHNDPPCCQDPCDKCGNWIGPGH